MGKRLFMHRRGDFMSPADNEALDILRQLPTGAVLRVDVTQSRNYELHKKAFSLVNLGFQYWEPNTMVSDVEKSTCIKLAEFLMAQGIDEQACYTLTTEFLRQLEARRATTEAEKSFEAFREWVTIKAGFCDVIKTPSGPRYRAQSWSFGSMEESKFQAMFQQILNVVWELVLSHHFASPEEAENAAAQLMNYA